MRRFFILCLALACTTPALGQNIERTDTIEYLRSQPYPVIEGDVTNRPYRVVGQVTKQLRKLSAFSKTPDFQAVQKELWERARKLNADAVVKAQWGESNNPTWTFAATEARGVAIKFLTDAEIAALPKP
ncbi:MAG: hypothetical protein RL339_1831 [Pseudomonadota bacterium]|jgi:hypothetical protein